MATKADYVRSMTRICNWTDSRWAQFVAGLQELGPLSSDEKEELTKLEQRLTAAIKAEAEALIEKGLPEDVAGEIAERIVQNTAESDIADVRERLAILKARADNLLIARAVYILNAFGLPGETVKQESIQRPVLTKTGKQKTKDGKPVFVTMQRVVVSTKSSVSGSSSGRKSANWSGWKDGVEPPSGNSARAQVARALYNHFVKGTDDIAKHLVGVKPKQVLASREIKDAYAAISGGSAAISVPRLFGEFLTRA